MPIDAEIEEYVQVTSKRGNILYYDKLITYRLEVVTDRLWQTHTHIHACTMYVATSACQPEHLLWKQTLWHKSNQGDK